MIIVLDRNITEEQKAQIVSLLRLEGLSFKEMPPAEGSMLFIIIHSGIPAGVTSVQFSPPSRLTWINPSSEPAHSSPSSYGDSHAAKIVQ